MRRHITWRSYIVAFALAMLLMWLWIYSPIPLAWRSVVDIILSSLGAVVIGGNIGYLFEHEEASE